MKSDFFSSYLSIFTMMMNNIFLEILIIAIRVQAIKSYFTFNIITLKGNILPAQKLYIKSILYKFTLKTLCIILNFNKEFLLKHCAHIYQLAFLLLNNIQRSLDQNEGFLKWIILSILLYCKIFLQKQILSCKKWSHKQFISI